MNQEVQKIVEDNVREGDLRGLLEKNLEMTAEVYHLVKKMHRTLVWQQIFNFVKILIIIIPLTIGLIYLPPLLKGVFEQYQELLGPLSGKQSADLENLKNLLPK